jgi:hypothetical protein
MLHDSNANYDIKLPWPEWQLKYVRLAEEVVRIPTAVGVICFNSLRKVNCEDMGTRREHKFSETTCSTSCLQDFLSIENVQWTAQKPL